MVVLPGYRLIIDLCVFQCYALLRIAALHFRDGRFGQGLIVCLGQHPVEAACQVLSITIGSYIAILLMVDLLWYAPNLEADARHAACHRFHDGIGQVF